MKIFVSVTAVLLSVVSVLSVSKAVIDSNRHRVVVPKPVQVYGPDYGQSVPARTQMLYRVNPFEEYYRAHRNYPHQSPVAFPYQGNSQPAQYQPNNFYPAAPQFIQAPGEQPMVYHPNVLSSPSQYTGGDPFNPQFVAGSRSELAGRVSSFNRGHVEFHPQREQVQTYTSFRDNQEEDSGLMSRSAVESRPISAEAYSGIRSEDSFAEEEEWNPNPGLMDRSNVEAYPANLMRLAADDIEEDPVNPSGYGSFGQAGFRAAVESPPIYTPQQDPSEAYPMLVKPNARPFGHLSEGLLHTNQRSVDYSAADVTPYNSFYRPRQQSMDPRYKLLCYYESWSNYRPSPQDFSIDRIDPHACTHLMYSFAGLDPDNYTITSLMPDYDVVAGGFKSIVSLKARNPELKVLIALGGWNEGGKKYSDMVTYSDLRKKFVSSAVKFVQENHFDGLDINWEYPGASDRGGRVTDKKNFALLVQELSAEFRPKGLLLSASVSPARFRVNEGYDVPTLADYLDFISVISYDLRGPWDGKADHNAPLRDRDVDTWAYRNLNVEDSMNYWVEKGADPSKLIMGIPFYGRTFTLENPSEFATGARVRYAGVEGSYTREPGFLAYYEICANEKQGGWLMDRDQAGGPFMVKGDQWIGYDDPDYIKLKMNHLRSKGYGGAMVWAIDLDDQLGICGSRWPLLTAVRQGLAYQEGGEQIVTTEQPKPESQPEEKPESQPDEKPESKPEEKPTSEPESKPTSVEESSENSSSIGHHRGKRRMSPSLYLRDDDSTPYTRQRYVLAAPDFTCKGPGFHRTESHCQVYFICDEFNNAYKFVCPYGLVFDDLREICNYPRYVTCGSSYTPLVSNSCGSDGLYSYPSDCSMYIWCNGGRKSIFSCPHKTNFDVTKGLCSSQTQSFCSHKMTKVATEITPSFKRGQLRQSSQRVVCFFSNWAHNRPGEGKYVPENVDASLCSHIMYAFASLDASTLLIKPFDLEVDIHNNFYKRILQLKDRQPSVKVMLSLGGWIDSTGDKYSRMVSNATARRELVSLVTDFVTAYGFDGLDLHWLYPGCPQGNCRAGNPSDKYNYAKLANEIKESFTRVDPSLELSATVAAPKGIVDYAYDVPALSRAVDFINIMTYDFHSSQDGETGHVAPLYKRPEEPFESRNTAYVMNYWKRLGADPNKLVMGVPFYGQTYTLSNIGQTGLKAPVVGPGEAGPITQQRGMISYMELCQKIRGSGWQVVRDPTNAIGPYAYRGDQWISYEDHTSMKAKAKFIKDSGYGGAMVWTIDFDDFLNKCCREPNPLLRILARELLEIPLAPPRPGGDCSAPPSPTTPPPLKKTTTYHSGKLTKPTTINWLTSEGPSGGNTTPRRTTIRKPTSTTPSTSTWWWTPPTTTRRTTTTTRRPTTTITTTTTRRTTRRTTTTRRPTTRRTTTRRTTTTRRPPSFGGGGKRPGDRCRGEEYFPLTGQCSKFLRCINNELTNAKCAPGLHWNQQKRICDWPANANCRKDEGIFSTRTTTPPPTTAPPAPWDSTTAPSAPWDSTTAPPAPWDSTTAPPAPWDSTTAPTIVSQEDKSCSPVGSKSNHPTDCGKFRNCDVTGWINMKCAPGLEWNNREKLCDWPTSAGCTIVVKDTNSCTVLPTRCSPQGLCGEPCPNGQVWGYGKCLPKEFIPDCFVEIPSVSATRDTTIATPTLAESSEPEPSGNTEGSKCSQDGATTGDSYNCQFYLQCNHGKYVSKDCGVGLHWNDVKKICDWPQNAGCKTSGVAPPVTPPSTGGMIGGGVTPPPVELEKITPSGQLSDDYMVVCYFTNWAWYRPGIGKYKPSDIDPSLCTHIVYGFAVLDYSTLKIKPHDTWADIDSGFYQKVTDLKRHGAKVTIAIGGWNDSEGDKYSRLVNSREARRKFIEHVLQFIEKYNFDGLDLDWEYPKCWQVNCDKGPASDKAAFALWIKELSEAFVPRGLLLSAAVSPSKKVIDAGYDVPACSKYLDWIAVMTYDYHGQWDKKTGHVAPSYYHPEDDYDYFNMDYTIRYWMEKGAAKNKLVLGMPMYGQSFTLNKASVNGLNAPARSGGTAGEFTRAKGFLAYYEICDRIMNRGWQVVKDPKGRMGPYAYKDNQWVSFDDVETIRSKSEYIRRMGLRGGMIWALDLDDFTNRCGQGAHPLLNTIKSVLGTPRGSSSIDNQGDKGPMGSSTGPGTNIPTRVEPAVTSPPKVEVATPSTEIGPVRTDEEYKVVCYFTNWAWYRQGEGKYLPGDIDPSLCTHIVYGFAVLDGTRLTIKPHDTWADFDNEFYKKVTALKSNKVKVLVAIGGWNDSRGSKYSKLVNSASARRQFNDHVIEFMLKHNFDGLDLDWEYPKCWQVDCKKGPDSDKPAFATWVRELHEAFKPHGLLLSAAVSPSNKVIDAGYDVPTVSRYLDWVAVMTYDYHGQWDKKTGHVAPMYMHPMDENPYFNTNYTIHYWIELGADPKKLILGMPMYGQSFTLSQSKDNGLNQKTYGGGEAGPYTRARGFLAYYEICHNILKKGWTVVRDEYQTMGPYAHRGNQWVGFDDLDVIRYKSEYIRQMGLGGGMIWALDLDDFRDRCGCGKYPLLKTINSVLRNTQPVSCPVLGGGAPTKLLPFGSAPHDRITTTPRPTTLPPWMTTRKTTIPPWKITKVTTIAPWRTTEKTTIPPWQTTKSPSATRPKPTTAPQITRTPEPDGVTGGDCRVGEYRPHGGDCSKFYECDQGKLIERKCFPGLHWSAQQNRCDWPKNAKCDASGGSTGPGVATAPPTSASTTTTETTTRWTAQTSKPATSTTRRPLPPVSAPDDGYKVVCYFTNWAWYRQGVGKYKPSDIDYELCTHVVYGFAVLDGNKLVIKPHDRWADLDNDFYGKVTDLRRHGTKVLIAIGGWNDSLGSKYSRLVNNPIARANFVRHVTEFVLKYNFDGLDLDWEYPKCWQVDCTKGPESDKQAFSAWIKELHEAFQPHGLLLSAAVSPNPKVIDAGYEVPQLDRYLDWIAVMTYDYHGHWDKRTGHVAPMYHYSESLTPKFNADFTINYWIELGADPKKIIMGMPLYGQSFTLRNQADNGYNATASKGRAGQYTRAAGFLSYYEICHKVTREGYTVVKDPEGAIGPYAYKDRQWFSYDDVNMIRYKSEYVKRKGLGGAMIWALDLDDFTNRCGCEEHPLLRTINRVLRNYPVPDPDCQY